MTSSPLGLDLLISTDWSLLQVGQSMYHQACTIKLVIYQHKKTKVKVNTGVCNCLSVCLIPLNDLLYTQYCASESVFSIHFIMFLCKSVQISHKCEWLNKADSTSYIWRYLLLSINHGKSTASVKKRLGRSESTSDDSPKKE